MAFSMQIHLDLLQEEHSQARNVTVSNIIAQGRQSYVNLSR